MKNRQNTDMKNYKTGFHKIDADFIKKCDEEFEILLERSVNKLCDDENIRVLGLTGPTCSGKTTAAKKLLTRRKELLQFHSTTFLRIAFLVTLLPRLMLKSWILTLPILLTPSCLQAL